MNRAKRIHFGIRTKNKGQRHRLSVFVSSKHIYVQIIDDVQAKTVLSESSIKEAGYNIQHAQIIGDKIGKKMKEQNITEVVFDRGNNKFHGKVKALKEAVEKHVSIGKALGVEKHV